MPRGRKRKVEFVPRPWIPNSSSEDEHQYAVPVRQQHIGGGGGQGRVEDHRDDRQRLPNGNFDY